MKIKNTFGKTLKLTRKAKGLTQEDFGIISSRTYLSMLERGLNSPTLEKVELLAKTMDVHPLALLTLSYLPNKTDKKLDALLKKITKQINDILANDD